MRADQRKRAIDRFLGQDPTLPGFEPWDIANYYLSFWALESGWRPDDLYDMPTPALISLSFTADEVISARKKQAAEAAANH